MTDDEDKAAEMVAGSVRSLLAHFAKVHDMPPEFVLASMHAEVMSIITSTYGGATAAHCARQAADRCEGLPSYADSDLAGMAVKGRA